MNSPIEEFLISSSATQSHLYVMQAPYVLNHFSNLGSNNCKNTGKYIQHCYLVVVDSFKQFVRLQDTLYKMANFKNSHANLTPFENRQEIQQHIKMMQRMNQTQFEDQYLEMLDLLEDQIEMKLIKDYCMKELHWSETKFRKLLQQKIDTIKKFLNYRGFNQLQKIQVKGLWNFIQKYIGPEKHES